jgi:hypothetical protein
VQRLWISPLAGSSFDLFSNCSTAVICSPSPATMSNISNYDSYIFFFQSSLLDSIEFTNIKGFENTIVGLFLATLSSQMLSRIVLRSGQLLVPVDIFKNSIVHFKEATEWNFKDRSDLLPSMSSIAHAKLSWVFNASMPILDILPGHKLLDTHY